MNDAYSVTGFDKYFKKIFDFCIVSFAFVTSIPVIDIHVFSTVLSSSLSVSPLNKCYTHCSYPTQPLTRLPFSQRTRLT